VQLVSLNRNDYKLDFFTESKLLHLIVNYIDPASGSAMIQYLIGALAGVGIAFKIFWTRIKNKIAEFNAKK